MSAREYLMEHVGIESTGDGRRYIDADEAECVLAIYDDQLKQPVKYVVEVHASYRDAVLEFDSPFEAVSFLRMWAQHLTFNEDESFKIMLRVDCDGVETEK